MATAQIGLKPQVFIEVKEIKQPVDLIVLQGVMKKLIQWRVDLEEAGGSLSEVTLHADLVLFDFCNILQLKPEETALVMGMYLSPDMLPDTGGLIQ